MTDAPKAPRLTSEELAPRQSSYVHALEHLTTRERAFLQMLGEGADPGAATIPDAYATIGALRYEHAALTAELAETRAKLIVVEQQVNTALDDWRTAASAADAALRDLAEARDTVERLHGELAKASGIAAVQWAYRADTASPRDAAADAWRSTGAGPHVPACDCSRRVRGLAADVIAAHQWWARSEDAPVARVTLERAVGRLALHINNSAATPPAAPLPVTADPAAPLDVDALPAFWDQRRRAQGKPDASRCAAELRRALAEASMADDCKGLVDHAAFCAVPEPAAQPQADARVSAPFGSDLITRMDHEAIVSKLRSQLDAWRAKNTSRAKHLEIERLARELCAAEYALRALGRQRYGGSPVDNGTMNDAKARRTAALDALSQALGTEGGT